MPKDATVKDVLYGLQFGRQVLARRQISFGKAAWSLEPSGMKVKEAIAQAAINGDRSVTCLWAGPNGEAHYGWSAAA